MEGPFPKGAALLFAQIRLAVTAVPSKTAIKPLFCLNSSLRRPGAAATFV
jgi:hypothetical protein